jgi:uncharacterized protein
MSRLLILILTVAAAYIIIKSLLGLVFYFSAKKSRGEALSKSVRGSEMIQDPACGIYIPKEKAIEGRVKGTAHYFCSAECLEKYKESGPSPAKTEEEK